MIEVWDERDLTSPALLRAALTDLYEPAELARTGDEWDQATLQRLAALSEEAAGLSRSGWTMRSDRQSELLAELVRRRQLDSALKNLPPHHPTAFELRLREALVGRPPPPQLSGEGRDAAIRAYEVALIALAASPDHTGRHAAAELHLRRLKDQTQQEVTEARARVLLPRRLIGRRSERRALRRYLATGALPPRQLASPPSGARVGLRGVLLTGKPGHGKSALLADLVPRERKAGAMVVLLDFDRSSLTQGGRAEWYTELTRQLGVGRPPLAEALSRLRREARRRGDELGGSARSVGAGIVTEALRGGLGEAIRDFGPTPNRLVLVFDTFEEVLIRSDLRPGRPAGDTLFGDLMAWADDLRFIQGPDGQVVFQEVRLIASGRGTSEFGEDLGSWFGAEFRLGDLTPAAARSFLRSRDVEHRFSETAIAQAVSHAGGHPLVLILVERFARSAGVEAVLQILETEGVVRLLSGQDSWRVLLTRFLNRLHLDRAVTQGVDPQRLQRLAHPGLVLREVTPRLLREVVAPACNIELDRQEAERALDVLAEQVWLVERVHGRSEPTVRHRPDIRQAMLPMMWGADASGRSPEALQGARAVSEAASGWFRQESNSRLDPADVESAYHDAFLGRGERLQDNARLARAVWNLAPEDVSAMPAKTQALLRLHARGANALSVAQLERLPAALREEATRVRARHAREQARFAEPAFAAPATLLETSEGLPPLPAVGAPAPAATYPFTRYALPPGYGADGRPKRTASDLAADAVLGEGVNAAFLAGDFHKAAQLGWTELMTLDVQDRMSHELPVRGSLTDHWFWRAALSRVVEPNAVPQTGWLQSFRHDLLRKASERPGELRAAEIVLACVAHIALSGDAQSLPGASQLASLGNVTRKINDISEPDQARIYSLLLRWTGAEVSDRELRVRGALLIEPDARRHAGSAELSSSTRRPLELRTLPAAELMLLLNSRLPELEEVTLALLTLSQQGPSRLMAAAKVMTERAEGWPLDLAGDSLTERLARSEALHSLAPRMITEANALGLLPEFVAAARRAGPNDVRLSNLERMLVSYRRMFTELPAVR